MLEQNSYIVTTIILNVCIIACWIWNGVIKFQENRSWHTYGCLVYAASYGLLVWINWGVLGAPGDKIVAANYLKVYFAYLLQLGASISFLIFSYTRDHKK